MIDSELAEKTAIKAALKGSKILIKFYNKKINVKDKSERDIVTEADFESEKIILSILKQKFPKHNYFSEEMGHENKKSEYTWIIDPLDGTVNFASKNPLFSISIALKYKKEIILSVIYLPVLNELFLAKKGRGATLNGKKIKVSSTNSLKESLSSIGSPVKTNEKVDAAIKMMNLLAPESRNTLILGSCPMVLAFISCGRIDNYLTFDSDIYNMSAGYLLIKEAGGKVTDFNGKEFSIEEDKLNAIASNGRLHKKLLKLIGKTNLK